LGRGEVRIEVVAHLAAALALREQHHQPLDRRGERSGIGASGLCEQGDQVRVRGEKVELRDEGGADALAGAVAGCRVIAKRLFQLRRPAGEYRAEQAPLRVEVVEQELLVDPRPAGDVVYPRAVEATPSELLAGSGDDA
jgi:hypothetical protein